MKKSDLKSKIVMLITLFVFVSMYATAANVAFNTPPKDFPPKNPKVAPIIDQTVDFIKKASPETKAKYISSKTIPGAKGTFPCRFTKDNKLQVYIYMSKIDQNSIGKLKSKGISADLKSDKRKVIQTYIPIDKIDEIAAINEVVLITLPAYAIINTGYVTTEADADWALGTALSREDSLRPIDTSNLKIGVMSDGIDGWRGSVGQHDDLPSTPTFRSFISYPNAIDQETLIAQGKEGLAMMQIINDLCPGAKMLFSNFSTDIEMTMSKEWLYSQGCNVIVDDIGFITAGPFDGTSEVSMKSAEIVQRGVSYFTSVGNQGDIHYLGTFTDSGQANGVHEFAYDDLAKKVDETLEFVSTSGAQIFVQWDQDDPAGDWVSSDDIDFYVYPADAVSSDAPVCASALIQNGTQPPYEWAILPDAGDFALIIKRKNANDHTPKRFHVFLLDASNLEYNIKNGSMMNNSDAGGGTVSVGAIDVNSPTRLFVEDFSSWGPTDDGRLKPEISCYDGVRTNVSGFSPFYGTSAAAPHAAGVAGLMLAINPNLTPGEITSIMQRYATDLYTPGFDFMSGAGRLEGYKMLEYLKDTVDNPTQTRSCIFEFNSEQSGWQPQIPIPGPNVPGFYYDNTRGSIVILTYNKSKGYGSWISPTIEFSDPLHTYETSKMVSENKLYEARFLIKIDEVAYPEVTPDDYIMFRLRIGSKNDAAIATKEIKAAKGSAEYPTGAGVYYSLLMVPPASTVGDGIYAAIDMMYYTVGAEPTRNVYIDEVKIIERNLP